MQPTAIAAFTLLLGAIAYAHSVSAKALKGAELKKCIAVKQVK